MMKPKEEILIDLEEDERRWREGKPIVIRKMSSVTHIVMPKKCFNSLSWFISAYSSSIGDVAILRAMEGVMSAEML